jgi:hypothetical protein
MTHEECDEHILSRSESLEEMKGLKDHSDRTAAKAVACRASECVDICSADTNMASGGVKKSSDELKKCALPAAGSADEEHLLARAELERREAEFEAAVVSESKRIDIKCGEMRSLRLSCG